MIKTITINTETHRVVPIEPTVEFFKLANIADFESWAGSCCAADNETIYRCAIESAPELNESAWLPIETAPKTSKSILVYNSENKCTYIVTYYIDKYDGSEGWLIFGSNSNKFVSCFTHWMPLPPAPEGI